MNSPANMENTNFGCWSKNNWGMAYESFVEFVKAACLVCRPHSSKDKFRSKTKGIWENYADKSTIQQKKVCFVFSVIIDIYVPQEWFWGRCFERSLKLCNCRELLRTAKEKLSSLPSKLLSIFSVGPCDKRN